MVNIQEVQDRELFEKIGDHEKKGGALRISVFKISENYLQEYPDEYLAHLITARQTLEKQNYKWNLHFNKVAGKGQRTDFKIAGTDYQQLDPSGRKIDLRHFLGPHFDIERYKPIVRGDLRTSNSYFYYDEGVEQANAVDINSRAEEFRKLYPENKGWFIYALMEPPYSMNLENDILKRGEYVLEFLEFFFGDIKEITIYSWSIECSLVFDAGKEWWGSYFWTIYNPAKQWYIGILASETD